VSKCSQCWRSSGPGTPICSPNALYAGKKADAFSWPNIQETQISQ
jgi:hypothetical protein